MPPPASLLFPTRRRREYLAVALASVAPQAAAHGAEIVVVEDDPADPETERLGRGPGRGGPAAPGGPGAPGAHLVGRPDPPGGGGGAPGRGGPGAAADHLARP